MRLREIKPHMVIHCRTQEEANAICDAVGASVKWKEYWGLYEEVTCYETDEDGMYCYGTVKAFEERYIFEFSDLIIPELSAEEVLKICNEICTGRNCNLCPMYRNCFMNGAADFKKVIELCEQWKADHEKKEPELEWVKVCRIIEIQSNGFKKCVHELDLAIEGTKEDKTLEDWLKRSAENELKRYISKHEGNYIAVVERVCRVKK